MRHLLTCLATSCLGFLSLLDEASLGFPPPLLPLQFCMYHLLKPFLSRSVSSPGSEAPEGGPGVPRPRCGLEVCVVSPLLRTGLEPHRSSSEVTAWGHTSCWDEGRVVARRGGQWGGRPSDHTDEGCSRWKGRCDQGQQPGPGREPLESEQSGSRTGLL